MPEVLTFEIPKSEPQEFAARLDNLIVELRSGHEKMAQDQIEIDRLKAETRQIASASRKILAELEEKWLKAA